MPERQASPSTPGLLNAPKAQVEVESTQLTIKPELEKPEIDLTFEPQSPAKFEIEPIKQEPVKIENRRRSIELKRQEQERIAEVAPEPELEPQPKPKPVKTVDKALLAQYKWQVLKVSEVQLPSHYDTSKPLNLDIHINPNGRVIDVLSKEADLSVKDLKFIKKSIEKWRFEPPKKLGIDINMNKSFLIDIKAS